MKERAIFLGLVGFLIPHVTGKKDEELTREFIRQGDGVVYTDSRPLNDGGTFARGPKLIGSEESI